MTLAQIENWARSARPTEAEPHRAMTIPQSPQQLYVTAAVCTTQRLVLIAQP
jgi:hypothetical protein